MPYHTTKKKKPKTMKPKKPKGKGKK